jgi:hypothetical protein
MFVAHTLRRSSARRGAVLIVVLAMLALFAVVGLSFVLYAESQASTARNQKISVNDDTRPDPLRAAELALGQMIYGTEDLDSVMRGNSLADSRFGFDGDTNPLTTQRNTLLTPFAGFGTPAEILNVINQPTNFQIDRRQVINFTRIVTNTNGTQWFVVDPQRATDPDGSGPQLATVRDHMWAPANANSPTLPGVFVNKAGAYTYPDRNNLYLGWMDPSTGKVVVKSFHRDDLFGTLAQSNTNWTTTDGRLKILRPRPEDHRYDPTTKTRLPAGSGTGRVDFPYPTANADGSITGDVSNLNFITGSQSNDSLWMDIHAPVMEWRGRKYKMLVAPLILDLNGRVNLSVAGNIRPNHPSLVPGHPRHASNHGLGVWEVNPTSVFFLPNTGNAVNDQTAKNNELLDILKQRFIVAGGTQIGAAPQADPYYSSNYARLNHLGWDTTNNRLTGLLPPRYALLDVDGVSTLTPNPDPITPAGATTYTPFPTYPQPAATPPPYGRYANTQILFSGGLVGHPGMFNPAMWQRGGPTGTTHPFGLDDQVKISSRYNDPKLKYTTTTTGAAAPTNMSNAATRALTTMYGFTQQWSEVAVTATGNPAGPNTSGIARLGPIDINRPLPEFRKNPLIPHSPINVWDPASANANEAAAYRAARQARQTLARDIFVRLAAQAFNPTNGTPLIDGAIPVASGGGNVFYEPESGYLVGPWNPTLGRHNDIQPTYTGFNTLRELAQYAANMVDFVDADDIMTTFVWNPDRSSTTNFPLPPDLTVTFDPSFDTPALANLAPATIGNRAVYGTELPKLVINEAYAALFNDLSHGGGRAMANMRKAFWVELHNPLSDDPTLPDNGGARLRYVQNTTQVQNPATGALQNYLGVTFSPYQIQVASQRRGSNHVYSGSLASTPSNVTGDLPTIPDLTHRLTVTDYDFSSPGSTPHASLGAGIQPDGLNLVKPANGLQNGLPKSNQGYYMVGPTEGNGGQGAFPDTGGVIGPTTKIADRSPNAMAYDTGGRDENHINEQVESRSTILLRRLADPYRLPNATTNPYITVDYVEDVPTADRVLNNDQLMNNTHTPSNPQARSAPSIGRRHPYATGPSYIDGTGTNPEAWRQQSTLGGGGMGDEPRHSFFSANDGLDNNRDHDGNPMTPQLGLEWLVHLDRHVINATELLHVSAAPPHSLTARFFDGAGTSTAASYHRHTRYWQGGSMVGTQPLLRHAGAQGLQFQNLYKAFDLIQAGNNMINVPLGGREPGKVNINMMNSQAVFNAVLDPQEGNSFYGTAFAANPMLTTGGIDVWTNLNTQQLNQTCARTPNGLPRATIDETGIAGGDRPFKGFGGSINIDETLFRYTHNTNTPPPGTVVAPIFQNNVATANHPYFQQEPLRKMWNSTTTVSDSFLVLMTIGFFEVINDGPYTLANQPILGKELFERIPGDLRGQFAAVVDRSNISRDPNLHNMAGTRGFGSVQRQLKLMRDAHPNTTTIVVEARPGPSANQFTVYDNGQALVLSATAGNPIPLRIGYGDLSGTGDGETIKATGATQYQMATLDNAGNVVMTNVPGHVQLTLAAGLTRFHAAGTRVGNSVVGHPGPNESLPQPFGLAQPAYSYHNGVVPYFTKIDP